MNLQVVRASNQRPHLDKRNIIIVSKYCLDRQVRGWLKQLPFDMRFFDETHHGGTTARSVNLLNNYGKGVFTLLMTATFCKPVETYSLPQEACIHWNVHDIQMCKQMCKHIYTQKNAFLEKHADVAHIIQQYADDTIHRNYSTYPELCVLTDELTDETIEKLRNETERGWSVESVFLLQRGFNDAEPCPQFQNEIEVIRLWHRLLGQRDEFGICTTTSFMSRIERICKQSERKSRWMGEGVLSDTPIVMIAFLPSDHIHLTTLALERIFERERQSCVQKYGVTERSSVLSQL